MTNPIYNYLKDALSVAIDARKMPYDNDVTVKVTLKLKNPDTGELVDISTSTTWITLPEIPE